MIHMMVPSWRSSIFICSSIGQVGVHGGTGVVQGGVEVRLRHGVDVVGVALLHQVVDVVLVVWLRHVVDVVVVALLHHVVHA